MCDLPEALVCCQQLLFPFLFVHVIGCQTYAFFAVVSHRYKRLLAQIKDQRTEMKHLQTQAQLQPKQRAALLAQAQAIEESTASLRLQVGEAYAAIRQKRLKLSQLSLALTSARKAQTADLCRRFEAAVKIQRSWRMHQQVGGFIPWLFRLNGQFELRQQFLFQYINTLFSDSSQIRHCRCVASLDDVLTVIVVSQTDSPWHVPTIW